MHEFMGPRKVSRCFMPFIAQCTATPSLNTRFDKLKIEIKNFLKIKIHKISNYEVLQLSIPHSNWWHWRLSLSDIKMHYNDECDDVSSHRRFDGLLNHLFRRRWQKTSKLRVTGLFVGNPPVNGGFPWNMKKLWVPGRVHWFMTAILPHRLVFVSLNCVHQLITYQSHCNSIYVLQHQYITANDFLSWWTCT